MSAPFITAKNFCAAKREVTWGTRVAPAAADFNIRLRDISIDDMQPEMYLRPFQSGRNGSNASPIPGKRMASIKCKYDMGAGASAGTPMLAGKLFEACGALETVALDFTGPLVTSNVVNGTVNGVALTPVTFATSSAATLAVLGAAIVAALAALGSPITATATVSGNSILVTRSTVNTSVALTAFVVTLGSGQVVASYRVVYNPQSGITAASNSMDAASASIDFYLTPTSGNAVIFATKGAMGNCKVTMDDLGHPLFAEFEFKACAVSITDGSLIALTSPDTAFPPATVGAVITNATIAQRIGKFELDFGNDVQLKYDPSQATGYIAAYISKREPRFTFNPQVALQADDPVWTRLIAGTATVFSFATAAVSGVRFTVAAPALVMLTNKLSDRNGESIWEQTHQAIEVVGNDEWSITQGA